MRLAPTRRFPASRRWFAAGAAALIAGCASGPSTDGPPDNPPPGIERTPDAVPRLEPIRAGGPNRPYAVAGRGYAPLTGDVPFAETGLASWYGRKFHGRPTSSGEIYDMFAMTAAHKTIPIPSYARVRNPANGREIVVRINDRGPFADGRVIDLSYAAAAKLGLLGGVAPVTVRRLTFADIRAGELLGQIGRIGPPQFGRARARAASDEAGPACQRPPVTSSTEPVV